MFVVIFHLSLVICVSVFVSVCGQTKPIDTVRVAAFVYSIRTPIHSNNKKCIDVIRTAIENQHKLFPKKHSVLFHIQYMMNHE